MSKKQQERLEGATSIVTPGRYVELKVTVKVQVAPRKGATLEECGEWAKLFVGNACGHAALQPLSAPFDGMNDVLGKGGLVSILPIDATLSE